MPQQPGDRTRPGSGRPVESTASEACARGLGKKLVTCRSLQGNHRLGHQSLLSLRPSHVNYHQERCEELEKHAHVVWQLDDQLRQDTIQPRRWDQPYWSDTCDAWVFAAGTVERLPKIIMRSGQQPEDPVRPRQSRRRWLIRKSHEHPVQAAPHDPLQPTPEEPVPPGRFRWHPPEFDHKWPNQYIFPLDGIKCIGYSRHPNDVWDAGPELAAEHSAADRAALAARLKDEVAAEKERRAKHEARWVEILGLPQLFIAG
jgi:hypothetical protein